MANFTPILISDNASERANKQAKYNELKSALALLVTAFNAMKYMKESVLTSIDPIVTNDIDRLINNSDELIYDKMTESATPAILGLSLDKNKLFEMMEKPQNYESFKVALNSFKNLFHVDNNEGFYYTTGLSSIKDEFIINTSGVPEFSPSLTTALSNVGKQYTKSEKQNAIYNFIKDIHDSFVENGLEKYVQVRTGGEAVDTVRYILKNVVRTSDLRAGTFEAHFNVLGE